MTAALVRRFARNDRGRDLVVGDVHGCFGKLREDLQAVGFNPDAGDRLFALGDLVDRGPQSADVLWWLDQPWFASVRGNHEVMSIDFFEGRDDMGMLAMNGGAWFLGMTPPERLQYVDAFRALPVAVELETADGLLGLVHADCPFPDWPAFIAALQGSDKFERGAILDRALWSRMRLDWGVVDGVTGVRAVLVGHTPVERVTSLGNVHYLDTGPWMQGGAIRKRFTVVDAATLSPAYGSALNPSPWV